MKTTKFWVSWGWWDGYEFFDKEPSRFNETRNGWHPHSTASWLPAHSVELLLGDMPRNPRILHEYERDKDGNIRHVTDWEPV